MSTHERTGTRVPRQREATFRPAFEAIAPPPPGPTTRVHDRALSRVLTERLDAMVAGGASTAAQGTARFPDDRAPVLARGRGAHVWDVDGNRYVEYAAGGGAVALGHGHPRVTDAVRAAVEMGEAFARPAALELDAAETLIAVVPDAETVTFVGGDAEALATAEAVARAVTGRSAVVATPGDDLSTLRSDGCLLVLDERATAFRRTPGAASVDVRPDLRIFGGALGNGFSVGAVTGSRDLMRYARPPRGAGVHALAAATAVLEAHRKEDVVATLDWIGRFLTEQLHEALTAVGMAERVRLTGPPCDLAYTVLDAAGDPSAELHATFLGTLLDHGVLAPSFAVNAALSDHDVQHTADAAHQAAQAVRLADDELVPRHRL